MADARDQHVTIRQLRALTGAEPGVVEGLVRARLIPERNGTVPLVAGIRAFLDRTRADARAASLTAAAASARDARAEADELAVAIADRRMIPSDDADAAVTAICGAITAALAVIPIKASRDVRDRHRIDEAVRRVQNQIAQTVAAIETVGDLDPQRPVRKRRGKA